jgi:hypothetical protein
VGEVQEAVNSQAEMVQYHALSLLYEIKQKDRLAVSKLVRCGHPLGTAPHRVSCLGPGALMAAAWVIPEHATRLVLHHLHLLLPH